VVHRHVAPEQEALAGHHGAQRVHDAAEEVEVDAADPLRRDSPAGAPAPQLEGLVGAEVDERAREEGVDLGEPVLDQRQRAGVAGGEDVAAGRLA
jgi:hypothetical protein